MRALAWNPEHAMHAPAVPDLRAHRLPYHPLWEEGYVSVGDWRTTRMFAPAGDAEATRCFGLKRECGIDGPEG